MNTKTNESIRSLSTRLNDSEKYSIVHQTDHDNSTILASAIVELWLSEKPSHINWSKFQTGVLCFIKNNSNKCHYFRVYDLKGELEWEQEMYFPFNYNKVSNNFHFFAANDCNVGFNFAFKDEAEKLITVVIITCNSIDELQVDAPTVVKSKKEPITNKISSEKKIESKKSNDKPQKENKRFNSMLHNKKEKAKTFFTSFRSSPDKKTVIAASKLEISGPNDFRVVQQVQVSGNRFKMKLTEDPMSNEIKDLLSKLNVKSNRKTQIFVGEFLKNYENPENKPKMEMVEETNSNEEEFYDAPESSNVASNVPPSNPLFADIVSKNRPNLKKVEPVEPKKFDHEPSMLNVLKNELDKRAQFLNDSSDDESDTTSEWGNS